jgi:hypothetical protein
MIHLKILTNMLAYAKHKSIVDNAHLINTTYNTSLNCLNNSELMSNLDLDNQCLFHKSIHFRDSNLALLENKLIKLQFSKKISFYCIRLNKRKILDLDFNLTDVPKFKNLSQSWP